MHIAATEGFLNAINLIDEYELFGAQKLEEVVKYCQREVEDIAGEFRELHFIPLSLYKIIGELLDCLGRIEESKALRMRLRDQIIDAPDRPDHPYFIQSNLELVKSYNRFGEWKEAEAVLNRLEKTLIRLFGAQNPLVVGVTTQLAMTYKMQER
jgi:hypothetical protein